jgi:hypothetical protein
MIFKLVNHTVMAIALFYVAEATGVIERGKYFPTLPRLEASASDPFAWLGAAQWGVSQVTQLARNSEVTAPLAVNDVRDLKLENVTTFAKRLEEKRDEALKSNTFGYYGS